LQQLPNHYVVCSQRRTPRLFFFLRDSHTPLPKMRGFLDRCGMVSRGVVSQANMNAAFFPSQKLGIIPGSCACSLSNIDAAPSLITELYYRVIAWPTPCANVPCICRPRALLSLKMLLRFGDPQTQDPY
jgi:hypothetical protein